MDQRIRIHADGEFSALKRQLKGLETDFKSFQRVVDRGANKGGFFSKADLDALDIFKSRYAEMDKLVQRSISEQIQKIRELDQARQRAYGNEKKRLEDEIAQRKKLVNELRSQQSTFRETYERSNAEAEGFGTLPEKKQGKGHIPGAGLVRGGLGTMLGVLGLSSLTGAAMKAYQEAVAREKYISDLGMRIGGSNPDFEGLRKNITNTGLRYGYNGLESMMAVENVSNRMGNISNGDQAAVQGFTRAFGLDLAQTSDTMGRFGQLGATRKNDMREFSDMLANAIERGGMTARAEEQIQATRALVEQVAQKQPGNIDASSLLALQTELNKTGLQGFMGERGAEFLSKLSSMFSNNDVNTSLFVDRALGYGKDKDYYQVQLAKEKGLTNPENLSRVLGAVSRIGTGLSPQKQAEMQDFALQHMTGISLTEAKSLREKTHGYADLSAENLKAISDTFQKSGTVEERVGIKNTSLGQQTNVADSRFEEALAKVGTNLIGPMNELKNKAADVIDKIGDEINGMDKLTMALYVLGGIITAQALKKGIDAFRNRGGGGSGSAGGGKKRDKGKKPPGGPGGAGDEIPHENIPHEELPHTGSKLKKFGGKVGAGLGIGFGLMSLFPDVAEAFSGGDSAGANTAAGPMGQSAFNIGMDAAAMAPGSDALVGMLQYLSQLENLKPEQIKQILNHNSTTGRTEMGTDSYIDPQLQTQLKNDQQYAASSSAEKQQQALNAAASPTVSDTDVKSIQDFMQSANALPPLPDSPEDQKKKKFMGVGETPKTTITDKDVQALKDYAQSLTNADADQVQHNQTAESLQKDHQDKTEKSQDKHFTSTEKDTLSHFGKVEGLANDTYSAMKATALSADSLLSDMRKQMPLFNNGFTPVGAYNGTTSWSAESAGDAYAYNPFSGFKITSAFGDQEPGLRSSPHHGVDFGTPEGTKLDAFMGGTVDDVGYDKSRGNYITVKTKAGDLYRYLHMEGMSPLHKGDPVLAGDFLGLSGATGDATGPHLHMDYQKKEADGSYKYIDPMQILSQLPTSIPPNMIGPKLPEGYQGTTNTPAASGSGYLKIDIDVKGLDSANTEIVTRIAEDTFRRLEHENVLVQPSSKRY